MMSGSCAGDCEPVVKVALNGAKLLPFVSFKPLVTLIVYCVNEASSAAGWVGRAAPAARLVGGGAGGVGVDVGVDELLVAGAADLHVGQVERRRINSGAGIGELHGH